MRQPCRVQPSPMPRLQVQPWVKILEQRLFGCFDADHASWQPVRPSLLAPAV